MSRTFFSLDRSGDGFSTSSPWSHGRGWILLFAFERFIRSCLVPSQLHLLLVATTAVDFETGKRGGCMGATHRSILGSWSSAFLGYPRGHERLQTVLGPPEGCAHPHKSDLMTTFGLYLLHRHCKNNFFILLSANSMKDYQNRAFRGRHSQIACPEVPIPQTATEDRLSSSNGLVSATKNFGRDMPNHLLAKVGTFHLRTYSD